MRITESQLRKFIRKELLSEAAKKPQDLPAGVHIKIYDDDTGGTAKYACTLFTDPIKNVMNSPVTGMIKWNKTLENKPNEVSLSDSTRGWGPLLYDIAIEMSGERGLMSDRWEVSPEAKKIWDYYYFNRPDIEKFQLDNKQNELTPTPKDNVDQDMAEQDEDVEHWSKSSLSKAYRSHGTPTIDNLKSLNKIRFMDEYTGSQQSQTVSQFLKNEQQKGQ